MSAYGCFDAIFPESRSAEARPASEAARPTSARLPLRLITFDLDGTLVDTAPEIAEAANRALQDHGLPCRGVGEIAQLIGGGARELMLKLLARIFLDEPPLVQRVNVDAALASFDCHYKDMAARSTRAYPHAHAALARLRAAGLSLACVTNKESRHALAVLHASGLADFFSVTIGGDTLAWKKPHGSVLRHVAEVLRVDTRAAAHVGDSAIDVQAARNAGVAAWAVPYGYNEGKPIADASPHLIFANLAQLASHALGGRPHSSKLSERA